MGSLQLGWALVLRLRNIQVGGAARVARFGVPFGVYLAFSAIWFVHSGDWRSDYLVYGDDPISFIWFLHWWPWAIGHGINPMVSRYVWYPQGGNMTWDTSVPVLALAAAVVTWVWGPVLSFNLLSVLAPVFAAWAAFLLGWELTGDWAACLVAGYVFGFSSYEVGQLLGHLNLEWVCLAPVAVWLCVRRVRGKVGRRGFVAAMAVVLAAQMGISTEVLAVAGVLGGMSWLVFWGVAPAGERRVLVGLAIEVVLAGVGAAVLMAPFLFYLIKGLAQVPAQIQSVDFFSTDLLNFIVPTANTRLGRTVFAGVAGQFTGNLCEDGGYVGAPLILLVILYFHASFQKPYVRGLAVVVVMLAVFSLGPSLHVGRFDGLMLPWRLVMGLPLMGQVLPVRIAMLVSLAVAVVVACWLAEGRGWWRGARFGLALAGCVCLAPDPSRFGWARFPVLPFFTPGHVAGALGAAPVVLILPYSYFGPGMAWQLDAGMGFRQVAGYVGFTPNSEAAWEVLRELGSGTLGPDFGDDLTAYCVAHGVEYVLMGPGTPAALRAAVEGLGWRARINGGVEIVTVPAASTLRFRYIAGDYYPSSAAMNWMGRQIEVVTGGAGAVLRLSGSSRPLTKPVRVTVSNRNGQVVYEVTQTSAVSLVLPAGTTTQVTADALFRPKDYLHNGDYRRLSVMVGLGPAG